MISFYLKTYFALVFTKIIVMRINNHSWVVIYVRSTKCLIFFNILSTYKENLQILLKYSKINIFCYILMFILVNVYIYIYIYIYIYKDEMYVFIFHSIFTTSHYLCYYETLYCIFQNCSWREGNKKNVNLHGHKNQNLWQETVFCLCLLWFP